MNKIILASSSPRRKQILEKMGLEFCIVKSDYDEYIENDLFSYEKIENIAKNKALSILSKCPNTIIISADTVVVFDDKILGKPKDRDNALEMLSMLRGKRHRVVTSICLLNSKNNSVYIKSITSFVTFKNFSDFLMNKYLDDFKPFDKAGSYGIQEMSEDYVEKIEGSFENIMGLCSKELENMLEQCEVL